MNEHEEAELWKVVRDVERSIETHRSECSIRNVNRDKWESRREEWEKDTDSDIDSLKLDRAKLMGYLIGAAGAGTVLGNIGIDVIENLFGK